MPEAIQDNDLSIDGAFDILRTEIRRELLWLLEAGDDAPVDELTTYIGNIIDKDSREVDTALRHGHLPMMESKHIIEIEDDVVSRGPQFERVMQVLRAVDEIDY